MSHAATNWLASITPENITAGEFRVLFHLCDCHNPSNGCFPTQEYLRGKTGLSNGGLNKCLSGLEEKELIQRHKRFNNVTKRQKPTRYMLGFECEDAQNMDTDAVCQICTRAQDVDAETQDVAEPSPLSGDGMPHPSGDGLLHSCGDGILHPSGEEPVREPVKEPVSKKTLQKKASQFPEDWMPGEKAIKFCLQKGYDQNQIGQMVEACVYYHRGKGTLFKNLDAAFRTWAIHQITYHGTPEIQRSKANAQYRHARGNADHDSLLDAIAYAATSFET